MLRYRFWVGFSIVLGLQLFGGDPALAFSLPSFTRYVIEPFKWVNEAVRWTRNNPLCIPGLICSPVREPYPEPVPGGRFGGRPGHYAVDFPLPPGGPVRAMFSGMVTRVFRSGNCGDGIEITDLSKTYRQLMCHVKSSLKPGQMVTAGQLVAYENGSGRTTGPHVHVAFYICKNGQNCKPVDVEAMLKDPEQVRAIISATSGHSSVASTEVSRVSTEESPGISTEWEAWRKIYQHKRSQREELEKYTKDLQQLREFFATNYERERLGVNLLLREEYRERTQSKLGYYQRFNKGFEQLNHQDAYNNANYPKLISILPSSTLP